MNRERDLDQTVKNWLHEGADQAPERFIWAALDDVERTAQRGAWLASLEGFLMKLKPVAPILGIAALIIVAMAAYQLLGGPNVGGPSPSPSPSSSAGSDPVPGGTFTSEDLANIVLTASNAPNAGWILETTLTGVPALVEPLRDGGPSIDQTEFVDARMTRLNITDTGGYVSWVAVFETSLTADLAYHDLQTAHESFLGWNLARSLDTGLGFESALYTGPAYGWESAVIYLWHTDNLVLAAVGVGDFEPDRVRSLVDEMDSRVR